jgi:MinD superfamily P-loop ATPase
MIISVASGKGGTGKTLVATSLACSLKDKNKVQLLDCDVEEPNAHLLLNPTITGSEPVNMQVPIIDRKKCTFCGKCAEVCAYKAIAVIGERVLTFHELCHSCGACSYLCPEKAIYEIGRPIGTLEFGTAGNIDFIHGRLNIGEAMATPVIRKVQEKANNQNIVIVDVPPGTSCPVVESIKDTDFCLLVTEPTPFGLNDLMLAVETVRMLQLPCGVIINRAGLGDEHIEKYCLGENIPVLLHIPLDSKIAGFYSRGFTLVEAIPEWKDEFIAVFNKIEEIVSERTCRAER